MVGPHFSLVAFVAYKLGAPLRVSRDLGKHLRDGCPVCGDDLVLVDRLMQENARARREAEAGRESETPFVAAGSH